MSGHETEQLSPSGLVRRIKKHILAKDHRFYAICTPGLEIVLAEELGKIGSVSELEQDRGGVAFTGSIESLIECSLKLRTANRIIIRIEEFLAKSYPELFNRIKRISWEPWIGFSSSFDVVVSSRKSKLHHTDNMADSVSEAISQSVASYGGVATRNSENPEVTIMIRFDEDRCSVSLDCSGELLYRRGYRIETGFAPVRETIAAALLSLAGAETADTIIDPMAGSGTFCIESYLMANHRPCNFNRSFAYEQWPLAPEIEGKIRFVRKKCSEEIIDRSITLIGNDIEPKATACAVHNAERVGSDAISFITGDFRDLDVAQNRGKTVIVCNPPYGKRVGADYQIEKLYSDLNVWMKNQCRGASVALLIPEGRENLFTSVQMNQKIPLSNGGIDVVAVIGTVK